MESNDVESDTGDTRVISDRYALVRQLGRGSQGTLWLADDRHSGEQVAIKELDLEFVDAWKAIELFEREGDALKSLDHPSIPDYVDAFHEADDAGGETFYLVQEYIEGTPLADELGAGELFDDDAARAFLDHMLETLDYMSTLNPPVVHRDIKPTNIIVRPDGTYALVDFGAVQTLMPETVGGSTVVGTTGFMPPEQLMGRANPASDVYALAATTLNALTGTDPVDFEANRMRLVFRDELEKRDVSNALITTLEGMLEPAIEDRFINANEVREALDDPSKLRRKEGTGALGDWDVAQERIQQLLDDAPEKPLSEVDVTPQFLTARIGPVKPGAGNWFIYMLLLAAMMVPPFIWLPDWWFIGPVGALVLTYLLRRWLSPVSESLQISDDEVVVKRAWHIVGLGKSEKSEIVPSQGEYLPFVYRVADAVEAYEKGEGKRPGIGYEGLVFETAYGNKATFGITVMSQNQIVSESRSGEGGELEWLRRIVTEYLRYVRGETSESVDD